MSSGPGLRLAALPASLTWQETPVSSELRGDAGLAVTASGGTDLFIDPAGGEPTLTAPRLLGSPPPGDFQLSARVGASLATTFDAGVLMVWFDERHWAKLCYELSPAGTPMVVSVVTHGWSDDANGFVVDTDQVWLRISRVGAAWAFHAHTDGESWQLIRYFRLTGPPDTTALVGFEAQSPLGPGCQVTFEEVSFVAQAPGDLRDGS
ncbi:DUF1349 domain-containing protein [Natronosporangium hydrolyticum]|uniref:DUF1349 domain-containing protein n=1 Tax=Natronosporangium hydrolyticum TaxID=2811111 RepID=A0A895YEY7_9ACTN|nr:DUF1349 domain-containing protein [Natronosporangium hydrolyticum]QSB16377.1 DUF1349 domain-containing protein [Natronosporangium hydrolyticum]